MLGQVAFVSESRRVVLITPCGKTRDHDVIASDIWWPVNGLEPPYRGQLVEFDIDRNCEATNIRNPSLQPPAVPRMKLAQPGGAAPAVGVRTQPAAGNLSGERLVDAGVSSDRVDAWRASHELALAERMAELRGRSACPPST
jgi:hypothetical protein